MCSIYICSLNTICARHKIVRFNVFAFFFFYCLVFGKVIFFSGFLKRHSMLDRNVRFHGGTSHIQKCTDFKYSTGGFFFLVDCLHSYDNYPIYTQDISTVGQSPRGSKCHQRATPHQEQGCLGSITHFFHFSLARRYYTILGHFLKTQYSISEIHHNSVCTGRWFIFYRVLALPRANRHSWFIFSPDVKHLGCFQVWAVTNTSSRNICVRVSART